MGIRFCAAGYHVGFVSVRGSVAIQTPDSWLSTVGHMNIEVKTSKVCPRLVAHVIHALSVEIYSIERKVFDGGCVIFLVIASRNRLGHEVKLHP